MGDRVGGGRVGSCERGRVLERGANGARQGGGRDRPAEGLVHGLGRRSSVEHGSARGGGASPGATDLRPYAAERRADTRAHRNDESAPDRGPLLSALERNNVTLQGVVDGQPMVFAHGFGCDQGMWRFVWPAFSHEYRIVLFDHVGFGGSDAAAFDRDRYSSLAGYAADVLEVCDELELDDVVFVGHSVSAMIGVLAAAARPSRFARLVLVAPSPRYLDDEGYVGGFSEQDIAGLLESLDSNFLGWSSVMAPAIMGNPDRPELGEELTNSFCPTDPKIASRFARVTFLSDNRADLPEVAVPTLILQTREDVIAAPAVGEYVHRQIPGSRFVILDATGHCPNLSAPSATVEAIRDFV